MLHSDVDPENIEISLEMMEVGRVAFFSALDKNEGSKTFVVSIYRAMRALEPKP